MEVIKESFEPVGSNLVQVLFGDFNCEGQIITPKEVLINSVRKFKKQVEEGKMVITTRPDFSIADTPGQRYKMFNTIDIFDAQYIVKDINLHYLEDKDVEFPKCQIIGIIKGLEKNKEKIIIDDDFYFVPRMTTVCDSDGNKLLSQLVSFDMVSKGQKC